MDFSGRYEIPAPPEYVWAALNDPVVLKACIPGCERLTRLDDHHLDAVAGVRVGPVKATFQATIEQSELDPPHRCFLRCEGRGGVAGFGSGEAEVRLASCGAGTVLTYTARATVGGKLARIGQRLVDGAARQIADDFFARFSAQAIGSHVKAAEVVPPDLPETIEEPAEEAETGRREGLASEIWVIGLIAVIVLLLALFGVAL
jgi:hypothetical protein